MDGYLPSKKKDAVIGEGTEENHITKALGRGQALGVGGVWALLFFLL
jgi:hypothetical protein